MGVPRVLVVEVVGPRPPVERRQAEPASGAAAAQALPEAGARSITGGPGSTKSSSTSGGGVLQSCAQDLHQNYA